MTSISGTTSRALLSITALALGATVYFLIPCRERESDDGQKTKKSAGTQTVDSASNSVRETSKAAPPAAEEAKDSLRLVVQRFRQASFLVDGKVVHVGEKCDIVEPTTAASCGLVVYISFAKSATTEKALQAARTVLNLPLLTHGSWGDGSSTTSVFDMASSSESRPYLLLVPQANLISKVKSQGKSIQYHGQIDKEVGKQLYADFLNYVRALLLEHQCATLKQPVPKWVTSVLDTKKTIDASVPPDEMFQDNSVYSEWDDDGIPTKDSNEQDLTKSAIKKLRKQRESQKKRYDKFLNTTVTNKPKSETADWSLLNPASCTVVGGTFGARQGLEICSDMGPFCHVVSL